MFPIRVVPDRTNPVKKTGPSGRGVPPPLSSSAIFGSAHAVLWGSEASFFWFEASLSLGLRFASNLRDYRLGNDKGQMTHELASPSIQVLGSLNKAASCATARGGNLGKLTGMGI